MPKSSPTIVWFRQDLRLADNPALSQAVQSGAPIVPIYILDDEGAGDWSMGGASRWWLHESLSALDKSLDGKLRFFSGPPEVLLPEIIEAMGATEIHWNRCYEPWRMQRDARIKKRLLDDGLRVRSHNGSLLFEPQSVSKLDGTPYKVFTPFYRKGCLTNAPAPAPAVGALTDISLFSKSPGNSPGNSLGEPLQALGLYPKVDWHQHMAKLWRPGESGAQERFQTFLDDGIFDYKSGRNRPDQQFVSRLSPHLHFGEISPHRIWQAVEPLLEDKRLADEVDHFRSELGWREFSNSLLYHWPEMTRENLQRKFNRFPWRNDADALRHWQKGTTGYPIVDAGMRELWTTGYMHNRVRMIVGSFLVKNLMLHWHHGEDWFWDTLLDADLANNSASWQWIAGCGADAAPYFRIFNPVTQGNRFDPNGDYVRRYVPELSALSNKKIHSPWLASAEELDAANIRLGDTYPLPIVDLKASRERALAAFKSLSQT